ncbi:MAG: hypothetical protein ABIG39_04165 [Candidatus Micrarchaeota archaeon]
MAKKTKEPSKGLRIERVDVLSVAKVSGVIGLGIGVIMGMIWGLLAAVSGSWVIAVIAFIGAPLFYGVIMFIGGAFYTWIYNVTAKRIGGVKMDCTEVKSD